MFWLRTLTFYVNCVKVLKVLCSFVKKCPVTLSLPVRLKTQFVEGPSPTFKVPSIILDGTLNVGLSA